MSGFSIFDLDYCDCAYKGTYLFIIMWFLFPTLAIVGVIGNSLLLLLEALSHTIFFLPLMLRIFPFLKAVINTRVNL